MEVAHLFNVPSVGDDGVSLWILQAVGPEAQHFMNDERAFPKGRKLMHVFVGLDSMKHQITNMKHSTPYLPTMIAS